MLKESKEVFEAEWLVGWSEIGNLILVAGHHREEVGELWVD